MGLDIFLHNAQIAALVQNQRSQLGIRFQPEYQHSKPRAVLSQQFEDDLNRVYWSKHSSRLPNYLENLLPEGQLRSVIAHSLGSPEMSDQQLLAAVGSDLPGAVAVTESSYPTQIESVDEAAPIQTGPERASDEELALRFSLAGVQLKFSMMRDGDRMTLPARGQGGDWIVKLPSKQFDGLVENEYATMKWAGLVGFDVPDVAIMDAESLKALEGRIATDLKGLAVRRYDRQGITRIHQEDFAQVFGWPPGLKYDFTAERLLVIVRAIIGEDAFDEQFRRMIFSIASGNNDAHLKNWSLIYPDKIRPALTPLYDQVSTIHWGKAVDRNLPFKIGGTREPHQVDSKVLDRLASRVKVTPERLRALTDQCLSRTREVWQEASSIMLERHKTAIKEHWSIVPILREAGSLE